MLDELFTDAAQLLLNLAYLSNNSLAKRDQQAATMYNNVSTLLADLQTKEKTDVQITQDQLATITAGQTQLATDLATDGTLFQSGLATLQASFQQQLSALSTPVDLTGVNTAFAALHTTATSLVNFGTAAGGTAPPTAITDTVTPLVSSVAANTAITDSNWQIGSTAGGSDIATNVSDAGYTLTVNADNSLTLGYPSTLAAGTALFVQADISGVGVATANFTTPVAATASAS